MKKRIVIIAAMAMILGLSGLVYASNNGALKSLAAKNVVNTQNSDEEDDAIENQNDNENNASQNAQDVLKWVDEMQLDKTEAKGDMAKAKDAVLQERKDLIEMRKTGTEQEIENAEDDLIAAIEAYKEAKAGMQTSVGELKKGDVQNNGVDNSDKEKHENNGHQDSDEE